MNESFGQKSTVATIGGAKESLVFGARYTLRYGADDTVLRDAFLGERAANGDLVFFDLAAGTRTRVRPSTIDSLVPGGDVGIPGGYSAATYLGVVETLLGSAYGAFVGSDEGQRALSAAAAEDRAARNGKVSRRADPTKVADVLTTIYPGVVASSRTVSLDDLSAEEANELLDRGARLADSLASEYEGDPEAADKVAARVVEEIPELAGKTYVGPPPAKPKARPYAERNQVWKCGECKRRTRQPVCENGHAPVAAPAGKRREDRGSK